MWTIAKSAFDWILWREYLRIDFGLRHMKKIFRTSFLECVSVNFPKHGSSEITLKALKFSLNNTNQIMHHLLATFMKVWQKHVLSVFFKFFPIKSFQGGTCKSGPVMDRQSCSFWSMTAVCAVAVKRTKQAEKMD